MKGTKLTRSSSYKNRSKRNDNKRNGYDANKAGKYNPKDDAGKTGSNDPSWYATDPSLLRDAASIPYSWAVGTAIDLHNPLLKTTNQTFSVPGLCTLYTAPSVGASDSPSSPINIAANATYAFIRHANAGHANYDSPDLTLYIMAMSQVYSYIVFLQRVYGEATLYAQRNRYLPDALLEAQSVNGDNIRQNLANFRYGINVLINKAASFAVPANMTIFQRHAFLYANIYSEGVSAKDQLYQIAPHGFWKFTLDKDGAGMLKYTPFKLEGGTLHTYSSLLNYGDSLLKPLIASEDMNIMSGDILKAYGDSNILKMTPLGTEYPIAPIYNQAVLEQIKNATIVGEMYQEWQYSSFDIKQSTNKGYLVHQPKVFREMGSDYKYTISANAIQTLLEDKIITTQVADVPPEVTMENTRFVISGYGFGKETIDIPGTPPTTTDAKSLYLYCGSEVVIAAKVSYYTFDTNGQNPKLQNVSFEYAQPIVSDAIDADAAVRSFRLLASLAHFKFRPQMHLVLGKAGSTPPAANFTTSQAYFDVDNYAVLSVDDIKKLHEAALMNELHVPSIGKF